MSKQPSNVGPHVKDPVVTAYPGGATDDVGRVREGDLVVEYMPASTAPKDPRTGKPVIDPATADKIVRPLQEWAANKEEASQILASAADTLGGATCRVFTMVLDSQYKDNRQLSSITTEGRVAREKAKAQHSLGHKEGQYWARKTAEGTCCQNAEGD